MSAQEVLTAVTDTPSRWRFAVGKNTPISFEVMEWNPLLKRWSEFDLSDIRWKVFLRGFLERDDTNLLFNQELTKRGDPKNFIEHAFYPGSTPQQGLFWEIVLVDDNTGQTGTRSGKVEKPLLTFRAGIEDAPVAGP